MLALGIILYGMLSVVLVASSRHVAVEATEEYTHPVRAPKLELVMGGMSAESNAAQDKAA